jgi:hypothetical protein
MLRTVKILTSNPSFNLLSSCNQAAINLRSIYVTRIDPGVGCLTEASGIQVTDWVQPQMDTGLEVGKFNINARAQHAFITVDSISSGEQTVFGILNQKLVWGETE